MRLDVFIWLVIILGVLILLPGIVAIIIVSIVHKKPKEKVESNEENAHDLEHR